MKLGNFLMFLLIALVGLGFFINDSIHTRTELRSTNQILETLKVENALLYQKMDEKSAEIVNLSAEKASFEEENIALHANNSQLLEKNIALVTIGESLKSENSQLKELVKEMALVSKPGIVLTAKIFSSLTGNRPSNAATTAALFSMFLIGSGVFAYRTVAKRYFKTPNTFNINVTRREMEALIRLRRRQ